MHVPLGLDFPYWVDADDIDLDYHIRATKLGGPAGDEELAEAVSQIVSEPLDHSHPLWQLHLIEGLTGDRSALVFKLHHASVDGISGIELHWVVFDPSPKTRRMPPPAARMAPPIAPSTATMLTNALSGLPGQALRAVVGTVRSLPYLDHLMPYRVTPGVAALAAASRRILRLVSRDDKPVVIEGTGLRVPATVFDRPVGGERRWAFTRVSLESARKLKHHFGITLNDVVVATMAGAVRSWLVESGELPDEPLVAVVPISVRCEDAAFGGNEVQVMLIELPTDEPDGQQRLVRTHQALRSAKERHNAIPVDAMRAANDLLMPELLSGRHERQCCSPGYAVLART
jgi:diacylglycerol O-acyltransferase / wax synthase